MEDKKEYTVKVKGLDYGADGAWIAFALLYVFLHGEPSLLDALIHFLMK